MTKAQMMKEKTSWAKWLESYGAEKFFEAFMRNAQNAISHCRYCGEEIYLDIAEGGGVPDWSTNDTIGGDYGCGESPDTGEDGTGSHMPEMRNQ